MDTTIKGQIITLTQFQNIQDDRLEEVQGITTKFINDPLVHPKDEAWLDGVHLWAGNSDEMQFFQVRYGIFLQASCVVRSPLSIIQLQKAIEPFGFSFKSWGVRSNCLYLCFEETSVAVQNPKFVEQNTSQEKPST